jgi:hypothetical protein
MDADFYPSFDRMDYQQQKCTVHLRREMSVVVRKISGRNRSEKGARTHEVMMSVMETTYRLQGKSFFQDGMECVQRQL